MKQSKKITILSVSLILLLQAVSFSSNQFQTSFSVLAQQNSSSSMVPSSSSSSMMSSSSMSSTSSIASSSSSMMSSSSMKSSEVSTQKMTGEVLSIKDRTLSVKIDDKTKEFNIPNNIKITRNSVEAAFSDIKPRDQVTITQSNQNQVIALEALDAGKASDMAKMIVPIVILVLVVLALLYYFLKKSQEGSIKTTPTRM